MIRVRQESEPSDFNANVRQPGLAFLRMTPRPTSRDFEKAAYWRRALSQLKASYGDVCAYSSVWIPSECTVDHYHPKSRYARLAYEWSNYRLALARMNNNKGESLIVLDPFTIQSGWFVLEFATLLVRPNAAESTVLQQRVQRSIDILKLNRDDALVNLRFEVFKSYREGRLSLTDLDPKYPFIAFEIRRQGIKTIVEEQSND